MKKILAVDFGTKRIGLAINKASLAEPLFILVNNDEVLDKFKEVCEEYDVELIVVGISENKMAQKTKNFVTKLKKKLLLPIEFVDETLSSKTVQNKLQEKGIKRSKKQQAIDHYAAAVILEEWLELNSPVKK